jgi:hypothetical protein
MRELPKFFASRLRRSWKTALLIVIVAVATIVVSALVSLWMSSYDNLHFPSIGTIQTVGVEAYWDQSLTNKSTVIQWGTLYPDTKTNITLYLRSASNIPTTLTLATENWTFANTVVNFTEPPNRQTYISLTWDYNNETLNPAQTIQTTLTLTITDDPTFLEFLVENNINTFRFDTRILAIETP